MRKEIGRMKRVPEYDNPATQQWNRTGTNATYSIESEDKKRKRVRVRCECVKTVCSFGGTKRLNLGGDAVANLPLSHILLV